MTDVNYPIFAEAAQRPGALSVSAARTENPRITLGDVIKLQITPGGDLEGVLPVNIDIVFINQVEANRGRERGTVIFIPKAPGGLAAGLTAFGNSNPSLIESSNPSIILENRVREQFLRDQFSYATLVVNYGGVTWVTAQQLASVLNSVDGIDAELLPEGNPGTIFTPKTLIGYQGNLAGITEPVIDYASRPSLSDFGWTRKGGVTCLLGNRQPGASSNSGSGCFYLAAGDSPDGTNFFGAKRTPEDLIGTEFEGLPLLGWWQVHGAPQRLSLVGTGFGQDPNQDNRQYVSFEIPTPGLPGAIGGRFTIIPELNLPANFIWTISEKEGDFDPIQAPGGYGEGLTPRDILLYQGQNAALTTSSTGTGKPVFRMFPDKKYYINLIATSSPPGTPPAELQPEPFKESDVAFLITQRARGRDTEVQDYPISFSSPGSGPPWFGDPNAPIGNFGPVPANISIETVREPSVVLDNTIRLRATPGGALAGVPPTNIRIVFVDSTVQGFSPSGLTAGLSTLISSDPRTATFGGADKVIRGTDSREFANTVLIVDYGGATKVTAQQLASVLNGVNGIDAELLPDRDPNRIFTPKTLIGSQGNLAGIEGPIIDYASRPSLSDFGWTRAPTCLLVGSPDTSLWHPGHSCFYFTGGENPNDNTGSAGLYNSNSRWWTRGNARRMVFIGGLGASPNQDNRRYISIELDTTGMPTTNRGGFPAVPQIAIAPPPENVIWTISEKEGDFDPIQPIGGYGSNILLYNPEYAGYDYVDLNSSIQSRFIMRPNTKYYLNMVATRSGIGTPPSEIQPLPTTPVRGNDPEFDYIANTRLIVFVPDIT